MLRCTSPTAHLDVREATREVPPLLLDRPLRRGDEWGFGVSRELGLVYLEDPSKYERFVAAICANCGHALWFSAFRYPAG